MKNRFFSMAGALNGFLAVALGAFGAHALRNKLPLNLLEAYEAGVRYHFHHALALLLVGLLGEKAASPFWGAVSGYFFMAGIVLFSGSLYVLALSGAKAWAMATPAGGVCLLAGWACLFIAFLKR